MLVVILSLIRTTVLGKLIHLGVHKFLNRMLDYQRSQHWKTWILWVNRACCWQWWTQTLGTMTHWWGHESVTTPNQIWHPRLSMPLRLCNWQLPLKQHPKGFSKGGITVKADSQPDLDKKYKLITGQIDPQIIIKLSTVIPPNVLWHSLAYFSIKYILAFHSVIHDCGVTIKVLLFY